jgi:site-specific DNA recombinase
MRDSANHERPRAEWIEIPVPALVSEETFALAQENLEHNKRHAPRRTIEPSILQGLVHCRQCGYTLYRTSTRSTARKIHYLGISLTGVTTIGSFVAHGGLSQNVG